MADYLPITDLEIEPEAPITSALQHKFRENPLAMFEGAAGAPKLHGSALNWATAENSWANTNQQVIMAVQGGIYATAREWRVSSGVSVASSRIINSLFINWDSDSTQLTRANYADFNVNVSAFQGTSPIAYFWSTYFADLAAEYTWLFLVKDALTGEIISTSHCPDHPAFGMDEFIAHPYQYMDMAGYDIFLVNLTKAQEKLVKIGQVPLIGGGYLDATTYNNGGYNIDHFRPSRSFKDSFNSLFALDFTPNPWITDKFTILRENIELGIPFPKIQIPEPPDVTRIGVTLI